VNHFAAEVDHFAGCVLQNEEWLTPGEAAATGRVVRVKR
jgi:hypothetical protein